jgi:hypothetical protein
MTLTAQEKKYLRLILEKELKHFKKDKSTMLLDLPVIFLKGEHDYKHFLENLIKKLG